MSDLIRREDAINEFWKSEIEFRPSQIDEVLRILNSIPSAEPKVGNWIEKDGMWCDDPTFRCSVCGEEYELLEGTPIDNGMNYCPNCGSRMFERRTDETDNK